MRGLAANPLIRRLMWRLWALLLCLPGLASADQAPISEDALKAALVFNFAKFVEWPAKAFADARTPISLCLYRESVSEFRTALSAFQGKQVQGRDIQVRAGVLQKDLVGCHILFIPEAHERWLPDVLRVAGTQNILTVSDLDDFVDNGGMIELLHQDGQPRFAINQETAQRAGLKISAQLLKLAKNVKGKAGTP